MSLHPSALSEAITAHASVYITSEATAYVTLKDKVKLFSVLKPLRHMREWRYSSIILDLGTRWR
jgi:hypothetical protein